jgi:hypothetical protein
MKTDYDFSDPSSGEIPDFPFPPDDGKRGAFSPLDTLETSEPSTSSSGYRSFLTSGMKPLIEKMDLLYQRLDSAAGTHKLFLYRTCHTNAAFLRHKESGKIRIGSNACKLRFCPLCQRTKSAIIAANVNSWLKEKKKPKFITLTLAHSDDRIDDQIDRLYKGFKALRREKLWKSTIKGGVWFFQIKKSSSDGRWHPHLHICSHGNYIDKFELSKLWESLTNDSKIVDVRRIDRAEKAAEYVARYAGTACQPKTLSEDDLFQLAQAIRSRRICGTFGTAKGLQLSIKPPTDSMEWERLDTFESINLSRHYDADAAEIWRCWRTGSKCFVLPKPPEKQIRADELEKQIKAKVEQMLLFGQK